MANPKSRQKTKKEIYVESEEFIEQRKLNSSRRGKFTISELERSGIILN